MAPAPGREEMDLPRANRAPAGRRHVALIERMATENSSWGYRWIQSELARCNLDTDGSLASLRDEVFR